MVTNPLTHNVKARDPVGSKNCKNSRNLSSKLLKITQPLLKMKENHATSPSNLPYLYLDTPPYPNSKYPSLPFSTSSLPLSTSSLPHLLNF